MKIPESKGYGMFPIVLLVERTNHGLPDYELATEHEARHVAGNAAIPIKLRITESKEFGNTVATVTSPDIANADGSISTVITRRNIPGEPDAEWLSVGFNHRTFSYPNCIIAYRTLRVDAWALTKLEMPEFLFMLERTHGTYSTAAYMYTYDNDTDLRPVHSLTMPAQSIWWLNPISD